MDERFFRAALFDLDGVVFDTEPQYTVFWGAECRRYHPDELGLEQRIKGQTLTQIMEGHFAHLGAEQQDIVRRLDAFELQMEYVYVAGFEAFVVDLRRAGVKTAVVTSSNRMKMDCVYAKRPEFRSLFDAILTSEDFSQSKPSPDCYLRAAARFGLDSRECVVFEDSFNGLRSGRGAGMAVVGLSTTNSATDIRLLADVVVADYVGLDFEKTRQMLGISR